MAQHQLGRTICLTLLSLVAFAGNSILCRLALVDEGIDPASFTGIRLVSGAIALLPFLRIRRNTQPQISPTEQSKSRAPWSLMSAVYLFVYAYCFSTAYVTLPAGVGALLLFGAVQIIMLSFGFLSGERPNLFQSIGIAMAIGGFLVQVLPGLTAPDPIGAALMTAAGVAWGAYSLRGRGVAFPRTSTARNFLMTAPLALLCVVPHLESIEFDSTGAILAVLSGALTSGLGYAIWYTALRGHTATSAALVQLAVPVLAALAGMLFLAEEFGFSCTFSGSLTG